MSEYAQVDYNRSNEPPCKGLPWLLYQVWNSASLTFNDDSSQPLPPLLTPPGPFRQVKEGENYETGHWAQQLSHVQSQLRGKNNTHSRALYLELHSLKLLRGLGPQTY